MCKYDEALAKYRAKQNKQRRIEKEKAESMAYYEAHKEEIEIGREAAILISKLSQMCRVELTIDDILGNITSPEELHFYFSKICKGV